jgi:hypothetical protein
MDVSITETGAYVFCARCKEKQQVAVGYNSAFMKRVAILQSLKMMGWVSAPKFLCVNCKAWIQEHGNRPPNGQEIKGWNA